MKRRVLSLILAACMTASPLRAQSDHFSIDALDVSLAELLQVLADRGGQNVITDGSLPVRRVTIRLHEVTFSEALRTISEAYGLRVHRAGNTLVVGDAPAMERRFPNDISAPAAHSQLFALRHAHLEDVVPALQSALGAGASVLPDHRNLAILVTGDARALVRAQTIVNAFDLPGEDHPQRAEAIALHHERAADVLKMLRTSGQSATLYGDDRRNVIIVVGSADVRSEVRSLVREIDAPGRQVLFEVRVADVEPVNDSSNVGIEFGGGGFGSGAASQVPFTLLRSSVTVNAQINALVQKGRASILAQPRVTSLNNHEATLLVGEQYPVVTVNQQTGFPSVQTIDVGVRLRVTPTIGDDGSISAELHPEVSQIIGFNDAFPIIANRKVDATLHVHDGETIVLGGLFQEVDSETVTKLPLLGDLPVFGSVFRNRQRSHTRDEVIFFITPHVMDIDAST